MNTRSKYCNESIDKICNICNEEFETICSPREKTYCSSRCTSINANKVAKEKRNLKYSKAEVCKMCGEDFMQKGITKDNINGCSQTCRFQIRNGARNCNNCGIEYYPKTKTSKVCSYECSGKLAQTAESKEKRTKTNLERYGVSNPFEAEEFKDKIKETNVERYGVENPLQRKEIMDKIKQTNLDRYGFESPLQNKDVMDKLKNTNLERYGAECSLNNEDVMNKTKETMMSKYGCEEPFLSEEIRDKIRQTNLERYGSENPFGSDMIKEKIKETNLDKYGAENYSNRDTAEQELQDRDHRVIKMYKAGQTEYDIAEELGYEYIAIRRVLLRNEIVTPGNVSQVNKYWAHLIKSKLGIEFKFEGQVFDNKRMRADLYNEDLKIAIDINPTITHSTQETPFPHRPLTTVKYHQERAIAAQENGWELIQVFDWDEEDGVIELLHSKFGMNKRIYARKCIVKEITIKESRAFLDVNHRQQGKANSSIQYGLFYEDELTQVMTFSKERFSRNRGADSYELLRLTSKKGVTVVGGASKLLKAFQRSDYRPEQIKTFADFSKGTGLSYEKLGMTYAGFANMNAYYANATTFEAYKVTEATNKFRKIYSGLGMTQKEYMNSKGFYRINDAGHKVFKWARDQQ